MDFNHNFGATIFYIFVVCGELVYCSSKGKVVIAGLFPLSYDVPEGSIGRGVRPAVDLAVEMINNSTAILSDHELEIVASDTKCDMAVATKFFFDMVDSNNTVAMVFGDACSNVSGPVAEISKEWDMWLVSQLHYASK